MTPCTVCERGHPPAASPRRAARFARGVIVPLVPAVAMIVAVGAGAVALGVGCATRGALDARVVVFAVGPYGPAPSDALPIRQADVLALKRLDAAVTGARYSWTGRDFSLTRGAYADLRPQGVQVRQRDRLRVAGTDLFVVRATADLVATYDEAHRRDFVRAIRIIGVEPVDVRPEGGDDGAPLDARALIERLHRAVERGARRMLRELYGSDTVQATGIVVVLAAELLTRTAAEPGRASPEAVPVDPLAYRYRTGEVREPLAPGVLEVRLDIRVIPDAPLVRLATGDPAR